MFVFLIVWIVVVNEFLCFFKVIFILEIGDGCFRNIVGWVIVLNIEFLNLM